MNFDDLEREALNENLLKTLIKLSKVDGEIADNEMMYILKAGLSMGIPKENIIPLWKEDYTGLVIPSSEQDRMSIMYYLIFVIESDKKVTKKEEELAYHYGLKLGFNHLMVADFLNVVKTKLSNDGEIMDLLTQVKKYLN